MAARWRAVVTATVLAVGATGALAAAVQAETPPGPRAGAVAGPSTASAVGHAMVLAPVTEHVIDPAVLPALAAAPRRAARTVTETIQLTVRGGDLDLVSRHASVALQPVPGSDRDWTGTLPPVRVIDARGTHEGWTVRWVLAAIDVDGSSPGEAMTVAKVRLTPDDPSVVDGLGDGLVAGDAGPSLPHGRILFGAAPGSGGGTYEAGAAVSVRIPRSFARTGITVHVAFILE